MRMRFFFILVILAVSTLACGLFSAGTVPPAAPLTLTPAASGEPYLIKGHFKVTKDRKSVV